MGILLGLFFLSAVIGLALWVDLRESRRVRQMMREGRLPERLLRKEPRSSNLAGAVLIVFWIVFLFALPLISWGLSGFVFRVLTPPQARIYLPPLPTLTAMLRNTALWVSILLGIFFIPTVFLWTLTQFITDMGVMRATKRFNAGDIGGATNEIRETITIKGPSPARMHALARFLLKQEKWREAYTILLDLERRRPRTTEYRGDKAWALWKMGEPKAALEALGPVRGRQFDPSDLRDICTFCHTLIELGEVERAWRQLRRAEYRFFRYTFPAHQVGELRDMIDDCRAHLAKHFPAKKSLGLDEL